MTLKNAPACFFSNSIHLTGKFKSILLRTWIALIYGWLSSHDFMLISSFSYGVVFAVCAAEYLFRITKYSTRYAFHWNIAEITYPY